MRGGRTPPLYILGTGWPAAAAWLLLFSGTGPGGGDGGGVGVGDGDGAGAGVVDTILLTADVVAEPATETPLAAKVLATTDGSSAEPSPAGSTAKSTVTEPWMTWMLRITILSALMPPSCVATSALKADSKDARSGEPPGIELISMSSANVAETPAASDGDGVGVGNVQLPSSTVAAAS